MVGVLSFYLFYFQKRAHFRNDPSGSQFLRALFYNYILGLKVFAQTCDGSVSVRFIRLMDGCMGWIGVSTLEILEVSIFFSFFINAFSYLGEYFFENWYQRGNIRARSSTIDLKIDLFSRLFFYMWKAARLGPLGPFGAHPLAPLNLNT